MISRFNRSLSLLVLSLLISPMAAFSADKAGRFMTGGGAGGVECPKFVQTMETARKKGGIGTLEYVLETQGYTNYLMGFESAFNKQTPLTCSLFNSYSPDQLLAWIENYCRQNPLKAFGAAANELADEVFPKRLRQCP